MSKRVKKAETKKSVKWWEEPDRCISPEMKAKLVHAEEEAKKKKED